MSKLYLAENFVRVREAMLFIAKKKTEKGLLNQFGGRKRLYLAIHYNKERGRPLEICLV